jgi:hypothetical protein
LTYIQCGPEKAELIGDRHEDDDEDLPVRKNRKVKMEVKEEERKQEFGS